MTVDHILHALMIPVLMQYMNLFHQKLSFLLFRKLLLFRQTLVATAVTSCTDKKGQNSYIYVLYIL